MEDLLDGLKRLKLRHTRDCVDEYCRIAATRDMSFHDFLKMVVNEEIAAREETQRIKRIRSAKLPGQKTLAEFDFGFQPSVPKREILELETLRFVENHENVVLLGPPGPVPWYSSSLFVHSKGLIPGELQLNSADYA